MSRDRTFNNAAREGVEWWLMNPYDPKAVANFFITAALQQGRDGISPMKLQKLMYYAYGWNLAIFGLPLVSERVQAWRFGPVFQSIYRACKDYEDQAIPQPLGSLKVDGTKLEFYTPSIEDGGDENAETRRLLVKIWEIYAPFSAFELSAMTHERGTPWHKVFEKYGGAIPSGAQIPDELIKEYFVQLGTRQGQPA